MSNLREIKLDKPASKEYIIETLRGLIEIAAKEKILFIEISYKTEKDRKLRGFTFGDSTILR